MPQQLATSVENNFTKGLITESTGLNFPENAATDCDNCEFTLVGDTLRREGIDYEVNFTTSTIDRNNSAINLYKWNNAGGDGLTQVIVQQTGSILYFYLSSSATVASPLSNHKLASTVDISTFVAAGGSFDTALECQFSDGNGYLFVYHPSCDPIYCTYSAGTITGNAITVQIRDFTGIPETGVTDDYRPLTLSNEHKYNLLNQGWLSGSPWSASSTTTNTPGTGAKTFIIATGVTGISAGQAITVSGATIGFTQHAVLNGTVTSYNSGTGSLVLSITSNTGNTLTQSIWTIVPVILGFVNTWFSAIGNYPSNSDVWWYFKNTTNVFDPATTQANTSIGLGAAPKGHNILNAFQQLRTSVSSVPSLTDVITTVRPRTGCWFQGRVWYTGVDAQQAATGDAPYYTWTESIYFSQIVQTVADFGQCYQQNDPTSQNLFDLLPTDGGVIQIQGCGSIYKLFPLQNALLIFAANGVWYLTGSQGIGFSANDYTIVKLSSVQSISSTSFIDVQGLPMFWNEEGIYSVESAKQGTSLLNSPLHVNPLEVLPLTVGTILSFYNKIPVQSKKFARGYYNPIDYNVQWIYKSTNETSVTNRYEFDRILNFNNSNKAFFPYSLAAIVAKPHIHGLVYVAGPGGSTSPDPVIKYLAAASNGAGLHDFTFADEHDSSYVDFKSYDGVGFNYVSYFITGYKLRGQAIKKFQPQYIQMYSRTSGAASAYKIQGLWDYSNSRNSGRWSSIQMITNALSRFDTVFRRHKIRGRGFALQFKILSVDGMPFDIQGWAIEDTVNQGT